LGKTSGILGCSNEMGLDSSDCAAAANINDINDIITYLSTS